MKSKIVLDVLKPYLQALEIHLRTWMARRPGVALTLIILSSVTVLPLVTSAALTPLVFLLNISDFLATKGTIYVIYTVIFQGVVLTVLLVVLFFIAFALATVLSIFHSYRSFYK